MSFALFHLLNTWMTIQIHRRQRTRNTRPGTFTRCQVFTWSISKVLQFNRIQRFNEFHVHPKELANDRDGFHIFFYLPSVYTLKNIRVSMMEDAVIRRASQKKMTVVPTGTMLFFFLHLSILLMERKKL